MSITIDASVFVASFVAQDIYHLASTEFLNRIENDKIDIFCPAILLPECACSVARRVGDTQLAMDAAEEVSNYSTLQLVPTTTHRANLAAQCGASAHLRGADALYVQVAAEFGATLVTWDSQMLVRGSATVTVMTPTDWLAANPV